MRKSLELNYRGLRRYPVARSVSSLASDQVWARAALADRWVSVTRPILQAVTGAFGLASMSLSLVNSFFAFQAVSQ